MQIQIIYKKYFSYFFRVFHLERWPFDVELFMIAQKYKVPVSELPVN
ncbi:unnamed protein product [Paramecium sonneborni]|uniref:Uncharacterized protein n=1 Tax=Paramecium sonneborni TaxID=65129 RepID=A0A8S1JVD9_9CILI|nr:unnamed protein product [Paramecium sonneborni]